MSASRIYFETATQGFVLEKPKTRAGCFSVEKFLGDTFQQIKKNNQNIDKITLNKLCKKNDVVGVIRAFYTDDLTKKNGHEAISDIYMYLLMIILFYIAHSELNFKYFNTALKIFDKINAIDDQQSLFDNWIVEILNEI
ncbi:MAG: hypothetical protein KDK36_19185 [Leptospiraceae bacterium]|nr:hypothetical protein [Leptospiraceae bacterium]